MTGELWYGMVWQILIFDSSTSITASLSRAKIERKGFALTIDSIEEYQTDSFPLNGPLAGEHKGEGFLVDHTIIPSYPTARGPNRVYRSTSHI